MINYLKENSEQSSIRLALILLTYSIVLILLSMSAYILILGINKIEITKWAEMGIFATGLATIVTGIAWNKVQQKKIENNKSN